ncbi:MAG: hypothetical protein QXV82_09320 [Ignisphaera sp.]
MPTYQFRWEFQLVSPQFPAVEFQIRIIIAGHLLKEWTVLLAPEMAPQGDTIVYDASEGLDATVQFRVSAGVPEGEYVDVYGYWWNSDGVSIAHATYTCQVPIWITHKWWLGPSEVIPPEAPPETPEDWLKLLTSNVLGLHSRLTDIASFTLNYAVNIQSLGALLSNLLSYAETPRKIYEFISGGASIFGQIPKLFELGLTWALTGQIPEQLANILDVFGRIIVSTCTYIGRNIGLTAGLLIEPVNAVFGGLIDGLLATEYIKTSARINDVFYNVFDKLRMNLEYEPPATFEKAKQSASTYLNILFTFTNIGGIVSFITDTIGNIQVFGSKLGLKGVGRWVSSIYWNLGLGWLTWTLFSSIVRSTISDPLESYYRLLYRPRLLAASECEEAILNGVMTVNDYRYVLACLGYNNDSIAVIIANLLTKIADKMASLMIQIADVDEDIVKIDTITIPDYQDKVAKINEQIEFITRDIENRKQTELAELDSSYIPRMTKLKDEISRVYEEELAKAQIEINKIVELGNIEIQKLEQQKEFATTSVALKKIQIRQWEIQEEVKIKTKALEDRAKEIARQKTMDLEAELNRLTQEYQSKQAVITQKYTGELEAKTYRLKYDRERYLRNIEFYSTVRKPLLIAKRTRLNNLYKRLSEASSMSTIEDLDEYVKQVLSKKKKLIPIQDKELEQQVPKLSELR